MAEAIVSGVLEKLISFVFEEIRKGVGPFMGAKKTLRTLSSNLKSIKAVLKDAEEKQVKEAAVRDWLDKLKEASYDIDDVLDEWRTKTLKLQIEGVESSSNSVLNNNIKKKVFLFFISPAFWFRRSLLGKIAFNVEELNERLNDIAREKDKFNFNVVRSVDQPHQRVKTTSFVDVSEIYGRDEENHILVSKLLSESTDQERKGLHIISVVGMGGIGKTTLAQLAYNNEKVVSHFDKRIWVCVSDPFDEFRIARAILEALSGHASFFGELQSLLEQIIDSIEGKRLLLVLDDVWTEDRVKWEPLYNCLKAGNLNKSKILVTSRKETVACMMESNEIITIKELSEEKCWTLFRRLAFFGRSPEEYEKLEEVGRKIVGKCKGLPLAAKTIGSLMRFKKTREEWQKILDNEMWNIEEFAKDVFPALVLSYIDLPYMLRQCFLYCAVFPKDYNMRKDQLIQLWMAQGYLGLEQDEEMEVIGQEYFNYLAARSFFQEFEKDDDNDIVGCKMHDIVHDFARFLSRSECASVEVNDSRERRIGSFYAKARHLSLMFRIRLPVFMLNAKKLHTLLLFQSDSLFSIEEKLFDELTRIRALGLNGIDQDWKSIKNVSSDIGKLLHLRYLNLSYRRILELPESLCELYNLQTLDITSCKYLNKLPQGMGKLINLRHLINNATDDLIYMPKGMESLTRLRTLSQFIVGVHSSEACTLHCLQDLYNLQGSLQIRGLGFVAAADVGEAENAQIIMKNKNLVHLILEFNMEMDTVRLNEIDEQVLESLQPPTCLEKLEIEGYSANSTVFPNNWFTLLTRLRVLRLSHCFNCENLPPLGQLLSLESLTIEHFDNVKRVKNEFLGTSTSTSTSSSSVSIIAFPKLKSLTFISMRKWEGWEYEITNEDFSIMPCLRSLELKKCSCLEALPEHLFQITTLQKLSISGCGILRKRCRKETGDYWRSISHIPTIQIDNLYVQRDGR